MHVASIAVIGFEGAIQYGQSLPEEDNSFSFVFTVDDAKTLHKTVVRKTIEYGEQFFRLRAGRRRQASSVPASHSGIYRGGAGRPRAIFGVTCVPGRQCHQDS